MGNCIQHGGGGSRGGAAFAGEVRRAAVQMQRLQRRGGGRRRSSSGEDEKEGHQEGAAPPPPVVKVKMVLTKGELGWLVARLKAGDRRLEDVLHEMAARKREGRAAAPGDGWRPSLESIVECPAETATEAAAANSGDD